MSSDARRFLGRLRAGLVLIPMLVGPGCGGDELPPDTARRSIAVADVPPTAMAAAKKALPGVEFSEAFKNVRPDGALHSFEIKGRNATGKTLEVRVSPAGEILEMD